MRPIATGDSVPAALIPIALLTKGNMAMDEFNQHYIDYYQRRDGYRQETPKPYFFVATKYGYLSPYPIATGLILTPFYAVPVYVYNQMHPTTAQWVFFAVVAEKISASAITAASVALFYLLCLKVGASRAMSLLLAAAYAFTTEAWVISSQALWQHGPGVFFILSSCLIALDHKEYPSVRKAVLIGLLCAVAVAIRPTNIIFCISLLLWTVAMRASYWLWCAIPVAAIASALGAYNIAIFGNVRGGYTMPFNADFLEGFSGILFSPGRGLLIYFPLALFGLAGYYRGLRERHAAAGFFTVLMISALLQIILFSKWPTWWGGYCYGPRYLTEIQPMLLLAAIPLFRQRQNDLLARAVFIVFFVWSFSIQAVGAFLYPAGDWNGSPINVDNALSRVWDWKDNPVARDITAFLKKQ
ncbi:MAG: hypothetical protein M0Z79_10675 [Nitrospiraceae bacterium]|nr:hypothetical protein [Nitrospiraceae bacterium]